MVMIGGPKMSDPNGQDVRLDEAALAGGAEKEASARNNKSKHAMNELTNERTNERLDLVGQWP
jgi:hypothetical protein